MARRPTGFTLLELMVATTVLAILAVTALPALSASLASGKTAGAKALFEGSVLRATTRAGNAGTPVVLCPARGGTCLATTDWSGGWLAFHDLDGDRIRTPGDVPVLAENALPGGTMMVTTAGRTRIIFQPNGATAGSNATFTFCDSRGAARAVSLILSNGGRLRETRASPDHAAACVSRLTAAR